MLFFAYALRECKTGDGVEDVNYKTTRFCLSLYNIFLILSKFNFITSSAKLRNAVTYYLWRVMVYKLTHKAKLTDN